MKYLTLILVLTLPVLAAAQNSTDIIYLRNGSIIKGKILKSDSVSCSIETCCGSIFVYNSTEIVKTESIVSDNVSDNASKAKGYFNYTSMGFLVGSSENEKKAPFSLVSEHNYRFNQYFSLGGVIGYEVPEEPVVPLGLNIKGLLPQNSALFFIGISAGYSFSLENPDDEFYETADGGYFFNAELGVMLPVSQSTSFFVAAGYRYNELNYTRTDWWLGDVDRKVIYNRLSVRFGLAFY